MFAAFVFFFFPRKLPIFSILSRRKSKSIIAGSIDAQQGKQQNGKAPQRRTSITKKGQRNTDNRQNTNDHSYIDRQMKKDDCRYTITINTSENRALPFGKLYDTHQQQSEEKQNTYCSHKALFLPDRTENKIGILLGYITKFGLRSIEKTFPGKTTRTDRYFRLVDIIAHPHRIFGDSQSHLDTGTLVRFKYMVNA